MEDKELYLEALGHAKKLAADLVIQCEQKDIPVYLLGMAADIIVQTIQNEYQKKVNALLTATEPSKGEKIN